MYGNDRSISRERFATIACVVTVHLILALILLWGLTPRIVRRVDDSLTLITLTPTPPPVPREAPARRMRSNTSPSRTARANLRAEPAPVSAAIAIVPPPLELPAPPISGDGAAASSGAESLPGPGTGAGGIGEGHGSGGNGFGAGGGVHAQLIRGTITAKDYPRGARRTNLSGAVTVRFTVQPNGRTTDCSVTRSSGVASLDAVTCKLIEKRFRYAPARDGSGQAVSEERGWRQTWWLEGPPPPD